MAHHCPSHQMAQLLHSGPQDSSKCSKELDRMFCIKSLQVISKAHPESNWQTETSLTWDPGLLPPSETTHSTTVVQDAHASDIFKNKSIVYHLTISLLQTSLHFNKFKIIDLKYNYQVKKIIRIFSHSFKDMLSVNMWICIPYLLMKSTHTLLNHSPLFWNNTRPIT